MNWALAVSRSSLGWSSLPRLSSQYLSRRTTWPHVARLAFVASILTGCGDSGPEVAPVSGRVTLDGVPLAGARIRFQPEASGGSPSYGTADQDGNYTLGYKRDHPGALAGWHTIRIERGSNDEAGNKTKEQALPARYNSASELREEVKAAEDNLINFELTTKG